MLQEYFQQINGETWLVENDRNNLKVSYRVKKVIASKQSDYQHVMIVDTYDFGKMLVLDGVVQTTSLDGHIYNEMITHVPLSIHPDPKKVLIIGGGDCGAAREVAKYPNIEIIDMIEIDELVVKWSKAYLQDVSGDLSDPRVRFLFKDGLIHVKEYQNHYDVVIVDSSDPIGPAEQLFSHEFYEDIFKALKSDGLMVCQSQSPLFHSDIMVQTYRYIRGLFTHHQLYTATVPTYPGGFWSFTLGSKKHHHVSFDLLPTDTKYVNKEIVNSCMLLPVFIQNKLNLIDNK
ncbi:polyamine aminopropyltransferase [Shimazuella kribbensis]|uniref:polyamine aminopropyltransferase n=1 Tax=Shimazuella kribbensis TaxID=139808 RepID=UPI001FE0BB53|nr:polyamine aminopropyltransferase [Shimazuella kribbensis]